METVLNKHGVVSCVRMGQWRMEGDEVMLLTSACISETGTKI